MKLGNIVVFGLALATAGLGADGAAVALTFEQISGKWCGSVSSYTFAPGLLTVTLYSDKSMRKYKIDDYQYSDTDITVNWMRDDEKLFTTFGEFSADDKFMVQVQNAAGPRREFRRCS